MSLPFQPILRYGGLKQASAELYFFFFSIYLFIIYLAAVGLSCGEQASLVAATVFFLVVALGLSCPMACGILVPQPGV